ncbi:hypothetical protein Scep_003451 [Stephania cephalantha]|uniref:Uncharacterized protein n=1 Tax=Stephania cephalantha TaxID=152367 RepID=A0AAP0PUE3_9MAGN
MAFYSGTLKYMDVVEPYHPERILDSLAMCNLYRSSVPWFLKVSHPVITNPSHEDEDMVATTIADNELLDHNRRALDAALRWMDSPPELCTLESARKMASDVVNFLSGRSLDPTTTTTATTTAAGTTTAYTDTSAPTQAGPRQSQHDSTSTHSTPANAPPPPVDARPRKRMHGKEYMFWLINMFIL